MLNFRVILGVADHHQQVKQTQEEKQEQIQAPLNQVFQYGLLYY